MYRFSANVSVTVQSPHTPSEDAHVRVQDNEPYLSDIERSAHTPEANLLNLDHIIAPMVSIQSTVPIHAERRNGSKTCTHTDHGTVF